MKELETICKELGVYYCKPKRPEQKDRYTKTEIEKMAQYEGW